jgi:polysaccharide pyruvyl transferase CsaB
MKSSTRPKLVLAGYFGAGNIGDEAILSAQIASLKPYFDLLVLSLNPESTANTHKVDCIKLPSLRKPREIGQFFRAVARCDALIVGGGGFLANRLQTFSIYYWLLLMFLAKSLRKKLILFSVGCGPFRDGIHSVLIRSVLNKADIILLRDSISEYLVKQVVRVSTPTRVTGDVAFLLEQEFHPDKSLTELIKNSQTPRILFVLCPRFHMRKLWKGYKYKKKYHDYATSMGQLVDFVIEEMNGTPIFLPFYPGDVPFYRDILKRTRHEKRVIFLNYTQNMNAILSLFREADIVIGARYHSIIFSIIAGTPILPIIYHHKSYAVVKHTKLPSLEIGADIEWRDINIRMAKATQNLLDIFANKQEYADLILTQKKELAQQAMENVLALLRIFQLEPTS